MAVKAVLFVCAQAILLQSISAQCIGAGLVGPWAGPFDAAPWGVAGTWGTGLYGAAGLYGAEAPAAAAASHGGALPVASGSAIPATGVSVASDNAYAGDLAVRGALPFLGTVSLAGELPTAGAGAVAFGCGNGAVGIVAEDIGAVGIAGPFGYGIGGYGYDAGFAGPYDLAGWGCGAFI